MVSTPGPPGNGRVAPVSQPACKARIPTDHQSTGLRSQTGPKGPTPEAFIKAAFLVYIRVCFVAVLFTYLWRLQLLKIMVLNIAQSLQSSHALNGEEV